MLIVVVMGKWSDDMYVHVSCFVVRGWAVSRWYINICNCDMFSGVDNVYLDHLKLCVVCIDAERV